MKTEIQKLTSLLKRTFEAGAWHGPSVKEALKDITPEIATKGLPNTHTIIELVAHMTSWRNFVCEKLEGNNQYQVGDEMNFPKLDNWKKAVDDLDASQARLLKAVENLSNDKLAELVPAQEFKYTYYTLIHGIIHHDTYHAGQIMIIKKVIGSR